ncbi:MAG: zinc dependent phospholipase C family protein [Lachnospiraceae bacterium]|nr:zinc dependent phospholipase C family protein [Lachnospiraceae bacterium]
MRKKSHISLARFIVQDMQIPAMEEHWKAFYLGSILPDCVPSFLTTKHEFDGTFDRVKNRISGLLEDEKGLEEHARVFMRRLGEVLHYLADYFTFPHNKIYPGNIKDHCYYEKELKFKLREYVSSGEAFQDRIETPELQTKEAVFQFIENAHEEYLRIKHSVEEDCMYIVRICHQVVQAILQIREPQTA